MSHCLNKLLNSDSYFKSNLAGSIFIPMTWPQLLAILDLSSPCKLKKNWGRLEEARGLHNLPILPLVSGLEPAGHCCPSPLPHDAGEHRLPQTTRLVKYLLK